ncbi:MAG TPA: hypothetical protein PKE69_08285 [Pyrinomonadaceae bacterium]|nr:hypothetical protein [Pyrinomonadaceae bacterium]
MKKLSAILVILLFFSLGIFAQKPESHKTVKENGWNLTSIQKLFDENSEFIIRKQMFYTETRDIEVDICSLKISQKVAFDYKDFFTEEKIASWDGSITPYISGVNRFSVGEKIFAYEVRFKFEATYNGVTEHLLCSNIGTFVDENGDGKFETEYFQLESVPDWVANRVNTIPKIKQ